MLTLKAMQRFAGNVKAEYILQQRFVLDQYQTKTDLLLCFSLPQICIVNQFTIEFTLMVKFIL